MKKRIALICFKYPPEYSGYGKQLKSVITKISEIDKEIGHVTKSSDREGTYSGNFSNSYPKGTKYYSIQGISTDKAIAVQKDNGTYIRATRDEKYAGNKYEVGNLISLAFIAAILLVIISIVITNYYGKRREE